MSDPTSFAALIRVAVVKYVAIFAVVVEKCRRKVVPAVTIALAAA